MFGHGVDIHGWGSCMRFMSVVEGVGRVYVYSYVGVYVVWVGRGCARMVTA